MLKTISKSSNKKTGPIAVTYRAGSQSVFGTCPNSCALKPESAQGSDIVDREYFSALQTAVPEGGVAWTYTHFSHRVLPAPIFAENFTTINISTDSIEEAMDSVRALFPTVVVRPESENRKVDWHNGTRFIRCPAEYQEKITCNNCGGDVPLCARPDRSYVIKFTAHGSQKKVIAIRNETGTGQGGCYGSGGPVRLQWERSKGETANDAEVLSQFVSSLPVGTKLRHHVVGDIGESL